MDALSLSLPRNAPSRFGVSAISAQGLPCTTLRKLSDRSLVQLVATTAPANAGATGADSSSSHTARTALDVVLAFCEELRVGYRTKDLDLHVLKLLFLHGVMFGSI